VTDRGSDVHGGRTLHIYRGVLRAGREGKAIGSPVACGHATFVKRNSVSRRRMGQQPNIVYLASVWVIPMEEFFARRTNMAASKIARAEAQALAHVRAEGAEAAVGAAEKILPNPQGRCRRRPRRT
jgi:hypothetical protein